MKEMNEVDFFHALRADCCAIDPLTSEVVTSPFKLCKGGEGPGLYRISELSTLCINDLLLDVKGLDLKKTASSAKMLEWPPRDFSEEW